MLDETFLFLRMVAYGGALFCTYDLIRGIRAAWKHKNFLVAIGDLLFWLVWGAFLFSRIYKFNNGILRWYLFLGWFLGAIIYLVAMSPMVFKIVRFLLKRLKMCFSWVNILGKGAVTRIFKILGIKYGEKVKSKKTQSAFKSDETE